VNGTTDSAAPSVSEWVSSPSADRQAWLHSVFERLQRPLVAYAMKLLGGDLGRAQDCVQETFVRLCREPQEKVESHVDAWLFKTCRNQALDVQRKESRMNVNSEAAALTGLRARESEPHQRLLHGEDQRRVEQRIAELPPLEQEVLQLRLGQGLSYKQIAEITDLSVSHVGVLLHQAVLRLKRALNPSDGIANA
jgi:RNA polymerase sigma-70 factor (ECF subfamily)